MASIREIKTRIKSVTETRQITKAMKLISAAKMRKARIQLEKALPYFKKVKSTMADILMHSESIQSPFLSSEDRTVKHKGYLILSGDKTLAGSYNHNIIKSAEEEINHDPDALLFVAGDVGKHYFIKNGYDVDMDFDYPVQNPTVYRARDISELLLSKYKAGEIDEVILVYTLLETSISLKPMVMKLLPLGLETLKSALEAESNGTKPDEGIVYEPTPEAVLDILIPKYVKGIVYGALTEAFASEQSARMTAMDNATSNADEVLHMLNLTYNRARQSAITQEISEIIGGAEALR